MTSPRFLLSETAYMAMCDDQMVFMDARNGQYLLLSGADTGYVSPIIATPGSKCELFETIRVSTEALEVAAELQKRGLLTAEATGKPYRPVVYQQVVREIPRIVRTDQPEPGIRDIARFATALLMARMMIKTKSIDRITKTVHGWKTASRAKPELQEFSEALELYRRTRPLFMTVENNCFVETLCMLAHFRNYASALTWRIGVRLQPFRAHAWLQWGDFAVDDEACTIHEYTVIMEI
ncbi:lasso peptide biosynthesis B2 protein [Polymorphobacter multimanifer]|uniref:Microcin J25-processing protein McjB C-terminal domain-containing protein n=1 Tax=Polymorphobacter multimanifer TaxID=1070431 RepID=A0A841L8Q9_9SPHN|nr:lasso peptide biosynthesis B2 protein [Polymorphobacter multimanifer]MBB6228944.1 hypothetical protein [Polymorphobacter multimanifer]